MFEQCSHGYVALTCPSCKGRPVAAAFAPQAAAVQAPRGNGKHYSGATFEARVELAGMWDDIMARARKAAETAETEATAAGKEKREELVAAATRDIEAETRRSLQQIRKEVADLTVLATEKVTRKSLNADDQRRLVEEALSEVDFTSLSGAEN